MIDEADRRHGMADTRGMPSRADMRACLRSLATRYPEGLVADQLRDVERVADHIHLVGSRKGFQVSLCDIGAGVGLFGPGCASFGMKVTIMDDFEDPVNREYGDSALAVHRTLGVEVQKRDPLETGFGFPAESLDVVTCFDTMEHWHRSPRSLFASVTQALRPGGLFVLSTPNCVNLRKRLTVPLGRGKWSAMADWYESEHFRGHVREPDVADLRYIGEQMRLQRIEILGRNWPGLCSPRLAIQRVTRWIDPLLRLRPSLCSAIDMIGWKA